MLCSLLMLCLRLPACAQDAVLVLSPASVLTTAAGTGRQGFAGDGAAATAALASPSALAYDAAGNLYFADTRNHRIRRIALNGTITTVAGGGTQGFSGDGGPGTAASLDSPAGIAVAPDGSLYIADTHNHRVRRVAADGIVTTVAGTGVSGFSGDTGPATAAQLRSPAAVAVGSLGELYVADTGNHRIRRIALDGTIATVAGNGREEARGDGGLAIAAGLDAPTGIVQRPGDLALLIADRLNSRIRVVTGDGNIATLPPGAAPLRKAAGLGVDGAGTVYVADRGNYRLRAIAANGSGVLLGSGEQGTPSATVPYNATPLGAPTAVVPDASGGVSFTDADHSQVQHLALPQLLFASTVAGQTSPVQTLALRNSGAESVAVTAVVLSGNFAQDGSGTCGTAPFALADNATCTVALVFAPTTVGAQSGTVAVVTAGLPQRALLQGTGVGAGTLLESSTLLGSSGNLSYVGTPVTLRAQVLVGGTQAPTGTVHLLDAATEIAQTALNPNATATFTTTALTPGQHALTAHYDGDARYSASASSIQTQTVVLAPDFTMTAATSSLSAIAGATAQMAVLLQPMNGTLNQQVTLQVDGLPTGATVSNDAPTPLVLGSNAVTVVFSMKTPATLSLRRNVGGVLAAALLGLPFLKRRHLRFFACAGIAVLPLLQGCGGGYLGGNTVKAQSTTHTYPITITATTMGVTGSALVHTATFTLVVQ